MPQAVIEKIPLPVNSCRSRRDSLEIANQIRKFGVAGDTKQHVKVIRH